MADDDGYFEANYEDEIDMEAEQREQEELDEDFLNSLEEAIGGVPVPATASAPATVLTAVTAAPAPVSAVLQALNKPSGGYSGLQQPYISKYSSAPRNPTPAEFAKELQEARASMLSANGVSDSSVAHALLNVAEMVTAKDHLVPKVTASQSFLHKFCEEASTAHIPCILANGSRFYLRKTSSPSSSTGSSISGSSKGETAPGEGGVERWGSLLSKPTSELQREADRIQTEALADRKLREEARREAELYGPSSGYGGGGPLSRG